MESIINMKTDKLIFQFWKLDLTLIYLNWFPKKLEHKTGLIDVDSCFIIKRI